MIKFLTRIFLLNVYLKNFTIYFSNISLFPNNSRGSIYLGGKDCSFLDQDYFIISIRYAYPFYFLH